MARAKRHYITNQIWHITQRCHKREFLLKFEQDRRRWIQWLFEARRRFSLVVLIYAVTSNHIHLLLKDDSDHRTNPLAIGLIAGRTAQQYNQRKKRKGSFWQDRCHATAIDTGEHLSKWPHGGHNEIQVPRRKNIIIAYERLRELAGFENYDSFVSAHRKWIQAALQQIDAKRESRRTERIAVGGRPFIEEIKNAMGAMAKGRCVQPGEGAFELREAQSVYNAIFVHENRDIDPK